MTQTTSSTRDETAPAGVLLEALDLTLAYGPVVALARASVVLGPGEVVTLTGPSGSGKSSLLLCLAGILRPDSGTVRYGGKAISRTSEDERSRLRRESFGFVFQFAELVPELTLWENVSLPLELNGVRRRDRLRQVEDMLGRLGIAEQAGRRPGQVSGGQVQRAAVARALIHRPRVVFADEPTGSLDRRNGELVLEALLNLAAEDGAAVVIATHDPTVAALGREVSMLDGRVAAARRKDI